MKFTPLVYKLECMVYVYTIGQNFSEVLPEIHGDGAMKRLIEQNLSIMVVL